MYQVVYRIHTHVRNDMHGHLGTFYRNIPYLSLACPPSDLLPVACCLPPPAACCLPPLAAWCLLSCTCCLLPAGCYLLPAACYLVPVACCLFVCCGLLPVAYCLLPSTCCPLSTAACCLLPAAYCLLPTALVRYRLVGDVDFQAVKEIAAKITPVGDIVVCICCGQLLLMFD